MENKNSALNYATDLRREVHTSGGALGDPGSPVGEIGTSSCIQFDYEN